MTEGQDPEQPGNNLTATQQTEAAGIQVRPEEVAAMAIQQAQLQVSIQAQSDVGQTATSVALAGIDLTAATLVASLEATIGAYWWIPFGFLVISAAFFIYSVLGDRLESGPPIKEFYESNADMDLLDAREAMLTQLVSAIQKNGETLQRAAWANWGYGCLALAALATFVLIVGHIGTPHARTQTSHSTAHPHVHLHPIPERQASIFLTPN